MPCYVTTDEAGTTIVCERGSRRRQTCAIAGCQRWADRLCDWPLEKLAFGASPRTCDAPMCRQHSYTPMVGVDWCPRHVEVHAMQALG